MNADGAKVGLWEPSQGFVKNARAAWVALRPLAVNLLERDRTVEAGVEAKRLRAGWDRPGFSVADVVAALAHGSAWHPDAARCLRLASRGENDF